MKKQGAMFLLRTDHDRIRRMLSGLVESSERPSHELASRLRKLSFELRAHARIEDTLLHRALGEVAENGAAETCRRLIASGQAEHQVVDELILPDLEDADLTTLDFGGRVRILQVVVEHHFDEEETHLFPAASELLSRNQLVGLAGRMREVRGRLARVSASATPSPRPLLSGPWRSGR